MNKQPAAPNTSYVYVLVRSDLPTPHKTIQAAHAVLAATLAYGQPRRSHPHLVLCAVENEAALEDAFNRLKDLHVSCCAFYEDDFVGQPMTAVATAPLVGAQRRPLRCYPLLT